MNISRKYYIRQQAIYVLELTKGFTPEQRKSFSTTIDTLESLSMFILELTNDIDVCDECGHKNEENCNTCPDLCCGIYKTEK